MAPSDLLEHLYDLFYFQKQQIASCASIQAHPVVYTEQKMRCKTCIVLAATIFTSFNANIKETTKRHLCRLALNKVNVVAVTTILVLQVGVGQSEQV